MSQPWGLCYSVDYRTFSLPLLNVHAAANVKDLAAEVKITQTYSNDTNGALEAVYSFPIPARAAVCSFVMIKEDGTRVVGHIKEKGEAREIYGSAVAQGKPAALMEQQTPDVFRLAVGNIQPQEKVQIELMYATELTEDEENDSVRFHLPVHVGARYGQAPLPFSTQNNHLWSFHPLLPTQPPFLQVFVDVEAAAPIAKITCPSHTVSTELGPDPALPNAQELPFSNYARISLTSEAPLDRDFVLTVKSAGLDAPRCVAELHPIHPTTALALTVVPRFKLPDVSRQEFVFLVDRSGSMGGGRIAAAKRALVVMLRSLPAKDSLFQVASFGNACTLFWEEGGLPYNQATLDDATQHVDSMDANYGGTEIRGALQRCFETRKTDRPTSVFVLTDGQAWDLDGVFNEVKSAVARAPAQAYLRVFVLGIGNSASTAMCEGISRVGNGTCMMVGEQEMNFTGKIARMLKAACSPMITNIEVDWGVPSVEADAATDEDDAFVIVSEEEDLRDVEEKGKGKELSLFDETLDPLQMDMQPAPPPPAVVLPPFPPVQQSPFKIRTLNPGNRVHIYAILQGKTVPKTVTLSGLTEDGSEIKLSVPVTLSNLPNTPDSPPAIHALAARKIIQDVEDGQHAISTAAPDDTDLLARTVKACIVRLAKTYSISSSQTSFVAVDVDYPTVDAHLPTDAPLNADGSPKRPMNAFMIFARSRRPQVSAENQSMRTGDVSKILSQEWKTMSPADKQVYLAQASQLKQGFNAKYPDYLYRRRPNNTRKHRQLAPSIGDTVYGDMDDEAESGFDAEAFLLLPNSAPLAYSDPTLSAPPTCVAVQHYDDAASKETQYLRRQCHSCKTTDPPSWRRSTLNPGKIVCNQCGLYERTHLRARPLRFDELRSGKRRRTEPAITHTVAEMDPLEALARLQSFDGCFSPAVLTLVQLNVDLAQARAALLDVSEVFATVIGMAYLRTKLGPTIERESWEAMYNKARTFVEGMLLTVGNFVRADALEATAVSLLA